MKRLMLALVALLSFGGPAVAQALAPGEVTLTIEVLGVADPDRAMIQQTLRGRGEDEAKAKADLAAQRAALTASLAKVGIAGSAIKFGDVRMEPDYAMAAAAAVDAAAESATEAAAAEDATTEDKNAARAGAADAAMAGAAAAAAAMPMDMPPPRRVATQTVMVTVSDLAKLEAVQAAIPIDEEYSYRNLQPFFSTSDPKAAHSRAIADALAKARAEADAYAAALGMRVVRIARVSSEKQGITWPDLMQWFGKVDDNGSPSEANFRRLAGSTYAGAKVDFVIAPK
jgi:uncharacterized protein YggE